MAMHPQTEGFLHYARRFHEAVGYVLAPSKEQQKKLDLAMVEVTAGFRKRGLSAEEGLEILLRLTMASIIHLDEEEQKAERPTA